MARKKGGRCCKVKAPCFSPRVHLDCTWRLAGQFAPHHHDDMEVGQMVPWGGGAVLATQVFEMPSGI